MIVFCTYTHLLLFNIPPLSFLLICICNVDLCQQKHKVVDFRYGPIVNLWQSSIALRKISEYANNLTNVQYSTNQ